MHIIPRHKIIRIHFHRLYLFVIASTRSWVRVRGVLAPLPQRHHHHRPFFWSSFSSSLMGIFFVFGFFLLREFYTYPPQACAQTKSFISLSVGMKTGFRIFYLSFFSGVYIYRYIYIRWDGKQPERTNEWALLFSYSVRLSPILWYMLQEVGDETRTQKPNRWAARNITVQTWPKEGAKTGKTHFGNNYWEEKRDGR